MVSYCCHLFNKASHWGLELAFSLSISWPQFSIRPASLHTALGTAYPRCAPGKCPGVCICFPSRSWHLRAGLLRVCWEVIRTAFKHPKASPHSQVAFWYPFTFHGSSDQHLLCISWSLWLVSSFTFFSLSWLVVCEDEWRELKASQPLACWNSSLNVGRLWTAVIATSIKNISCPQDRTVWKVCLPHVAYADTWARASSISVWFLDKFFRL